MPLLAVNIPRHGGTSVRPSRRHTRPEGARSGGMPPAFGTGPERGHAAQAGYFSQASTLSRFASTHFFAAASADILSTAMYLATAFCSSFVQLNFFTRS